MKLPNLKGINIKKCPLCGNTHPKCIRYTDDPNQTVVRHLVGCPKCSLWIDLPGTDAITKWNTRV